jgi:tetratricopeptide (TPR) repeat protein
MTLQLGDPTKTLGYYRQALQLRQELADAAPGNTAAQLSLTRSYADIGDLSFRLNDLAAAQEHHLKALAVRQALFEARPTNQLRLDLAGSHGMLGEIAFRTGNLEAARLPYDRSLALFQELVDSDPDNVAYRRNLGIAHYRAGTLARLLKDEPARERHFRACLELREQIVAADQKNDLRRRELMVVLPHCGQHQRAAEMADAMWTGQAVDRALLFEIACCYAQCAAAAAPDAALSRGYTDKAIQALGEAVRHGYKDTVMLETDPDLEPVRTLAGFQELLKQLRSQTPAPGGER